MSAKGAPVQRHVLFLIDQFFGSAGAEGALLKIVRLLPKDRYRCSVATFRVGKDGPLPILERFPCPLHVLPLEKTYDWNAAKVAVGLRRLIRAGKVSIVHTFFETSDIWGGLVAKLSGCPVLVSSRRDMGILRTAKHRVAYRLMSRLFDCVQTVSEQVRAFTIAEDRINPEKVVTIHNGVDLDDIARANGAHDLRLSADLAKASHVIATVSNIRPVKGIDNLVEVAARVCQRFPRAIFLVIGGVHDFDHFAFVKDLARQRGVSDNIRFLGSTNRVFSLLKMSDMFYLPSKSEGLSNALLEAMACGLPCVATEVGGNPEVIAEGESGFLVATEDQDGAAARIIGLLEDSGRRRHMGNRGREIVEAKFSAQHMVGRLTQLYDHLLAQRQF